MLYIKNMPVWQRVLRAAAGLAMVCWGLIGLQGLAVGYIVALTGVVSVLTGFFGFCPMCKSGECVLESRKIGSPRTSIREYLK